MLEKVKRALRANGSAFDDEINDLIESAKYDLAAGGVYVDTRNPLIVTAIITYCKSKYGYDDVQTAELFDKSYQSQKAMLATSCGVCPEGEVL